MVTVRSVAFTLNEMGTIWKPFGRAAGRGRMGPDWAIVLRIYLRVNRSRESGKGKIT